MVGWCGYMYLVCGTVSTQTPEITTQTPEITTPVESTSHLVAESRRE